jgi:hypothetical protein
MASDNHILVDWIPAVHAGMTGYFYGYEFVIGVKFVGHGLKQAPIPLLELES